MSNIPYKNTDNDLQDITTIMNGPNNTPVSTSGSCLTMKRIADSVVHSNISKKMKMEHDGEFPQADDEGNCSRITRVTKKKNFVIACEKIAHERYNDKRERFLLNLLSDISSSENDTKMVVNELSKHSIEAFMIDFRSHSWSESLQVCKCMLKHNTHLSAQVLTNIVHIAMNCHTDTYGGCSVNYILNQCQQVLKLSFATHPPSSENIRKIYKIFLLQAISKKTLSPLSHCTIHGCDQGIFKYCLNLLEYELSGNSKDLPVVDKSQNIPDDVKSGVGAVYWEIEKLEIFEALPRLQRIDRLMIVLDCMTELLQQDLALWHMRLVMRPHKMIMKEGLFEQIVMLKSVNHTHNQIKHIMKKHKPLMAMILWSKNVLFTGAISSNCRQILKLFAYVVHLEYPDKYIQILKKLVNTLMQTYYMCEIDSAKDYPNVGKYCKNVVEEFYKLITDFPAESFINILQNLEPTFMKYMIGTLYLNEVLKSKEGDILVILVDVLKKKRWVEFESVNVIREKEIVIKPSKNTRRLYAFLSKVSSVSHKWNKDDEEICLKKFQNIENKKVPLPSRQQFTKILYLTCKYYLEAYSIQEVHESIQKFNSNTLETTNDNKMDVEEIGHATFSVSTGFVKKYRTIYEQLKRIVILLMDLKSHSSYKYFAEFEEISILNL